MDKDMDNHLTAQILENAADGFESGRYEWRQKFFGNPETGMCAYGALAYEAWQLEKTIDHRKVAIHRQRAKVALLCQVRMSITWWNDYKVKSKEEVIDTMKETAKRIRNGELQ